MSVTIGYTVNAQQASTVYIEPHGWSIGMNIGETDLWGNIGTKSVIDHYNNSKYFDKVCFMGGMFGKYTVHPSFAIRAQINYGTLYATDAWNTNKAKKATTQGADAYQRLLRNEDTKDNIIEPTLLFEITPFRFNPESKAAHRSGQPYVALGFSYFHFQPYSRVGNNGDFIKTYDLHLNGEGFGAGYPSTYSLWQPAVPLAIGYRFDLGKHLNLGLEYMYRLTFTTTLDNVSGDYVDPLVLKSHMSAQNAANAVSIYEKSGYGFPNSPAQTGESRGNSKKDGYSTISIVFYYKVLTKTVEWWQ